MTAVPDLTTLSDAQKDALIVALFQQLAAAEARITALEARIAELARPPKTPDNSSQPPSRGQKQNTPPAGTNSAPRAGRPGAGRALHRTPTVNSLAITTP